MMTQVAETHGLRYDDIKNKTHIRNWSDANAEAQKIAERRANRAPPKRNSGRRSKGRGRQ